MHPCPLDSDNWFVVQLHQKPTSSHYDIRFTYMRERGRCTLLSFAISSSKYKDYLNGVASRVAVFPTSDHEVSYGSFSGMLRRGDKTEYITIEDKGRVTYRKLSARKITLIFHGRRLRGKHIFLRIDRNQSSDPYCAGAKWLLIRGYN